MRAAATGVRHDHEGHRGAAWRDGDSGHEPVRRRRGARARRVEEALSRPAASVFAWRRALTAIGQSLYCVPASFVNLFAVWFQIFAAAAAAIGGLASSLCVSLLGSVAFFASRFVALVFSVFSCCGRRDVPCS